MKLEKLHLNRNKIIATVIAVIVVVIGIMIIKHTYSIGTESSLFNQTVSQLTFRDGIVETENGISTVKINVTNDSDEIYNLKNISIEIISDGETLNLIGYIGESMEKDETKLIVASIDKNINNIKEVKYTINK